MEIIDKVPAKFRGRPLAAEDWIAAQEAATGRALAPKKRGPKPRRGPGSAIPAPT